MILAIFVIAVLLIAGGLLGFYGAINLIPTDLGLAYFHAGTLSLVAGLVTMALGFAARANVHALRRVATPAAFIAPVPSPAAVFPPQPEPARVEPARPDVPSAGSALSGATIAGAGLAGAGLAGAGLAGAALAGGAGAGGTTLTVARVETPEAPFVGMPSGQPASLTVTDAPGEPEPATTLELPLMDLATPDPDVPPRDRPAVDLPPVDSSSPDLPSLDLPPVDLPAPLDLAAFAPAETVTPASAEAVIPDDPASTVPAPLTADVKATDAPFTLPEFTLPEFTLPMPPIPDLGALRLDPIPAPPLLSIEEEIRAELNRKAEPVPEPVLPPPPAAPASASPDPAGPLMESQGAVSQDSADQGSANQVSGLIADADLAALEEAAPPLAPLETLEVVGSYDSGGTRFTMYSDGSVVASGPEGETRYPSLQDLRRHLDQIAG